MIMKLKNAVKIIIILSVLCFYGIAPAQDSEAKAKEAADQAALFEKILKAYETRKQKEQDDLAIKFNNTLNSHINAWIDASKKDKNAKIGTRLQQNWEKLSSTFKISPSHYEYYLRGYKYTIVKAEVLKTLSLTTSYRGLANIKEDLYVEKYHSPDVSDANPYFYTVTTDYILNYEYKDDKFELVTTESQITGFVNDAPVEIKKPKNLI